MITLKVVQYALYYKNYVYYITLRLMIIILIVEKILKS